MSCRLLLPLPFTYAADDAPPFSLATLLMPLPLLFADSGRRNALLPQQLRLILRRRLLIRAAALSLLMLMPCDIAILR